MKRDEIFELLKKKTEEILKEFWDRVLVDQVVAIVCKLKEEMLKREVFPEITRALNEELKRKISQILTDFNENLSYSMKNTEEKVNNFVENLKTKIFEIIGEITKQLKVVKTIILSLPFLLLFSFISGVYITKRMFGPRIKGIKILNTKYKIATERYALKDTLKLMVYTTRIRDTVGKCIIPALNKQIILYDDGKHNDGLKEDGIFSTEKFILPSGNYNYILAFSDFYKEYSLTVTKNIAKIEFPERREWGPRASKFKVKVLTNFPFKKAILFIDGRSVLVTKSPSIKLNLEKFISKEGKHKIKLRVFLKEGLTYEKEKVILWDKNPPKIFYSYEIKRDKIKIKWKVEDNFSISSVFLKTDNTYEIDASGEKTLPIGENEKLYLIAFDKANNVRREEIELSEPNLALMQKRNKIQIKCECDSLKIRSKIPYKYHCTKNKLTIYINKPLATTLKLKLLLFKGRGKWVKDFEKYIDLLPPVIKMADYKIINDSLLLSYYVEDNAMLSTVKCSVFTPNTSYERIIKREISSKKLKEDFFLLTDKLQEEKISRVNLIALDKYGNERVYSLKITRIEPIIKKKEDRVVIDCSHRRHIKKLIVKINDRVLSTTSLPLILTRHYLNPMLNQISIKWVLKTDKGFMSKTFKFYNDVTLPKISIKIPNVICDSIIKVKVKVKDDTLVKQVKFYWDDSLLIRKMFDKKEIDLILSLQLKLGKNIFKVVAYDLNDSSILEKEIEIKQFEGFPIEESTFYYINPSIVNKIEKIYREITRKTPKEGLKLYLSYYKQIDKENAKIWETMEECLYSDKKRFVKEIKKIIESKNL